MPTVVRGLQEWRSACQWALLGIGLAVAGFFVSACASAPDQLSYIVVPHPDDEMQAWSLIEDTPDTYKVFIMLTKGEQTAFCVSPAFDEGTGEAQPHPRPAGRFSPACEAARQNSFFYFITAMADSDSGLPSSFDHEGVKGPFHSLGYEICRHDVLDYDDEDCVVDLTAEVWTSPQAAVVWFNLGDGDLTANEVAWAITTVQENQAALGIDSSLRPSSLIGASFWNAAHPDCFVYEHDDHWAVHAALWHIDFGMGQQLAATCRSDPEAARSEQVSLAAFDRAFETASTTRIGAHTVFYGWLWGEHPGYWPGDYDGQNELFHRHQSFWVLSGQQ